MGPDSDTEAVVDHRLRIKGIKNLRQIDAGVVPIIPSGNINVPVIMVAERDADFVMEAWK